MPDMILFNQLPDGTFDSNDGFRAGAVIYHYMHGKHNIIAVQ